MMKTTLSKETTKAQSLFAPIAHLQGSVWLDSSLSFGDRGQESLIASKPASSAIFTAKHELSSPTNCFQTMDIEKFLRHIEQLTVEQKMVAVGYIGYEAACMLAGNTTKSDICSQLPLAHFYFYESALLVDHQNGEVTNLGDGQPPDYKSDVSFYPESSLPHAEPEIEQSITRDQYLKKVKVVKDYIREGDIYQANFTNKILVKSSNSPFDVYNSLRNLNPASYSSYLNFGDYQVLSSSPERMFSVHERNIISSPIKGTIEIGKTEHETADKMAQLLNSVKDKAELLMIVDLVRNDLGKIAKTGTVRVDEIYKPEIYSSLIHLVSDVSATLKDSATITDIFRAMLPGGSITGAPKLRAIEIIDELETEPRHVYTGSIGYIYGDRMEFNIAIRTMTHLDGNYSIHAGGGIVADSEPELEYNEMNLKARNLFRSLGAEVTK